MTTLLALLFAGQAPAIDYPIVYCRVAHDATTKQQMPEVTTPIQAAPGTDLMLRHPDGTIETLVDSQGVGAVFDPFVTFDGKSVLYAFCSDITKTVRGGQPVVGIDVCRIDLATREITRLTDAASTVDPSNRFSFGEQNMGPVPVTDPLDPSRYRIAFTSTRNGFASNGLGRTTLHQLYVMDEDGRNVECITPMSLGGVLHPFPAADGTILFSTHEGHGYRDGKMWGVWSIHSDGRYWEPRFSAFSRVNALHGHGQKSDGTYGVIDYYHANNNGAGVLVEWQDGPFGPPQAGSHPDWPTVEMRVILTKDGGWRREGRNWPFAPWGAATPTPFAHAADHGASPNPFPDEHPTPGGTLGKVSHPEGAPSNRWLVTWHHGDDGTPETWGTGIYLLPEGGAVWPWDMTKIADEPGDLEYNARAVVPYVRTHGIAHPLVPTIPDQHCPVTLPAGSPFGIVGSSSVYQRESANENRSLKNWTAQGSDSETPWTNADIEFIRFVGEMPTRGLGVKVKPTYDFEAPIHERLRILGEVAVRKHGILDSAGNPDTSFLAVIPADVPFTFQLLDGKKRVLSMAQTWHQVRPGEVRTDCRGCHAHHNKGIEFDGTIASTVAPAMALGGLQQIEYHADVEPILAAHCFRCHGPDVDPPSADFRMGVDMIAHSDRTVRAPATKVIAYRSRESDLLDHVLGLDGKAQMPPDAEPLSEMEVATLIEWIELGAAYDVEPGSGAVKRDEQPPTLTVDSPRRIEASPVQVIRFGAFDEGGLDDAGFIVTSSVEVEGMPPGSNLAGLFSLSEHVYSLTLGTALSDNGKLKVRVQDAAGNVTFVDREYSIGTAPPNPDPDPDPTPTDNVAKLREIERLAKEVRESLEP